MFALLLSHLFQTAEYTFRFNMWTQQPELHRRKATQEFVSIYIYIYIYQYIYIFFTFLLRFLSRERLSRSFPSSTVKSRFVYPRHNRSPLVGHDVRESSSGVTPSRFELMSQGQNVSRLPAEPPGRPATYLRQTTTTTAACGSYVY